MIIVGKYMFFDREECELFSRLFAEYDKLYSEFGRQFFRLISTKALPAKIAE